MSAWLGTQASAGSRRPLAALIPGVSVLLYVALMLLVAASWEPSHDEGVSWDQAVARVELPGLGAPVAMRELASLVDGSRAPRLAGVVERLLEPGGMHPPAWYWGLNLWVRLGGSGRLWLVLPMLALGSLTLLAFGAIARRLVPVYGSAELAMLLLALSPWFVGYGVLARPYGFALCLAVLATHALIRSRNGSPHWLALFLALSTLGLYSLYHYAFVCGWHLAWLIVGAWIGPSEARRTSLRDAALCLGVWSAAYLAWLPRLIGHLEHSGRGDWYFSGALPLLDWPAHAWQLTNAFLLGDALGHGAGGALVLAASILLGASTLLFVRALRTGARTRGDHWARAAFSSAALVPLAILLSDVVRDTRTFSLTKTSFVLLPIGLLCLTRACSESPDAAVRRVAAGLWLGLFLAANAFVLDAQWRRDSVVTRLADEVSSRDAADQLLVLSSGSAGYVVPLLLALRDAGVAETRVALVREDPPLEGLLLGGAPSTGFAGVTLVHFEIPWEPSGWRDGSLRRLARAAAARGWHVRSLDSPAPAPGHALRVLTIVSPTWVRFFSR